MTEEQRAAFLAAIEANKEIGHVVALRAAGLEGTKGELKALLTDDLLEDAREARGQNIRRVEAAAWEVAQDTTHPNWDRANARILKAYGGSQFHDRVDVNGRMEVETPDLTAAIDRFIALTARAVREAARSRTGSPLADAAAGGEGEPRVPVAQLERAADPASS